MGDYWKGGGLEDSDSGVGSPPTYSSGEGYGFKAKQQAGKQRASKSGGDDYDFEIEGGDGSDEDIDLGGYQPRAGKPTASSVDARRASQTRRKSTDERTKEILMASREAARIGAAGADSGKADKVDEIMEDEPMTVGGKDSWKSSWDNLMEGLNSPASDAASPPQRPGAGGARQPESASKDIESSYNSDSMDISASDFQVGADAAKRAKEKTQARQRRKALEEAPHVTKERRVPAAKVAASPDVRQRQAGRDAPASFQISTALSSIQRSGDSLAISEDGGETGYLGHGGVASSRGDGDLYKMLGGRDSAASATAAGAGRYSQNISGSNSPAGARRADVSDFSNSADGPPVTGGAGGDDDSGDSGDSGDSDLAQSAEFVSQPGRGERRKGFSAAPGPSGPQDGGLSSDEYNSEEERERKKRRDSELAVSQEDREERNRLRNIEEIRNRWLNPGAKPGAAAGAAAAAGGSALDYLEESNERRDDKAGDTTADSGSSLPQTDADRRLASEEAELMGQMVDPNPAAVSAAPAPAPAPVPAPTTGASVDLSQSKLITAVGSASMVTSVPPPPPPAMTASEDNMVTTQAAVVEQPASRTSVLLYSDSEKGADGNEDSSLGLGETAESMQPDQDSVLQGLAVGGAEGTHPVSNNRYNRTGDEDSPERNSAPAPAAAKPDITKNPQYIAQLAQYQQQPVVIAHELGVGDDRDSLRSGGASAVDALGRRSAASGSGGQPFLNKIVATEIDPATLGIPTNKRSRERHSGGRGSRGSHDGGIGATAASRPPPPPAPSSWPQELPMDNPNTTDLHAHLAMMESSEARRILAVKAQAAKIREAKAVNKRQGSTPAAGAAAAKRANAAKGGPDYSKKGAASAAGAGTAANPAVNRLEAGTARLARQFEALEKELKAVKANRSSSSSSSSGFSAGGDSSIQVTAGITPASVGGYAGTPVRSSAIPVAAPRSQQPVDLGIVPPPAPAPTSSRSSGGRGRDQRDSAEEWEGEALTSMRRIVQESDKLDDKAKGLAAREEALRVREAMVDMDLRNPNRNGRMAPASRKGGAGAGAGAEGEEHPLVLELQEVEKAQQEEINTLKARCFKLQNRLDDAEDPDKSMSSQQEGGEGEEKRESKRKHYSEMLAGDKKGGGKEGEEEMITVPRAKYDGLFDEIKSQETLIEGFQKENEKLLGSLRTMEAEYNRDKARFFDQRESINRDLNRLRNATGETASEQLAPATVTGSIGFPGPGSTGTGTGGGDGGLRRSAETLREELDSAAAIFNLREQVAMAESGKGAREQELKKTIERLRSDVRDLQAEKAGVTAKSMAALQAEKAEQDGKVRGLEGEISSLKRKLVWYAENQSLIDDAEREKAELASVQAALKKELRRRGMDAPQVQALVSLAMDHRGRAEPPSMSPSDFDEDSMMSGFGGSSRATGRGGASRGGNQHRSNSDIRRIKELEAVVEELQDGLRRRNPDSVSSLVRAATVGEDVQEERREHAAVVARMHSDLESAQEEFDRRLRSLRQEHDKVKMGYENRIRDLETLGAEASANAVPSTGAGAGAGVGGSEGAKSLAAANARIKELEAEASRIRVFYTKKVEEVQKKAEAQMHAIKRAPSSPQTPSEGAGAGTGGAGVGDTDTIAPTGTFEISEVDKLANLRAELKSERDAEVSTLQKQIDAQAKEIGSLRANSRVEALLAASGLMPASPATPAARAPSEKVVEATRSKGQETGMTPLAAAIAAEAEDSLTAGAGAEQVQQEATQQAVDSLLAAAAALSPVPIKVGGGTIASSAASPGEVTAEQVRSSPLWQAELSAALAASAGVGVGAGAGAGALSGDSAELSRRLREEEMRASSLMSEVVQLRTQLLSATNVNAPYPVQMMAPAPAVNPSHAAQLENMERHIKSLETRLGRRESELLGAIESSKTGAKLERARLDAMHQTEIREKDEQLVRFQQELEQLVYCLRQWQMEAKSKGSSGVAMGGIGVALPGMPPSPATALMPVV